MGAIAAIGTAVGAVLGSVGIAATAIALTLGFETITAVGAVLGVVGAVTHNKALGLLALGAVGGIGAIASSAGLLGSGAGLLGEAPTRQQNQNLQMPKSVASSVPVTGEAQLVPIAPQPKPPPPAPGFINQAPVQSAPVTGAAA